MHSLLAAFPPHPSASDPCNSLILRVLVSGSASGRTKTKAETDDKQEWGHCFKEVRRPPRERLLRREDENRRLSIGFSNTNTKRPLQKRGACGSQAAAAWRVSSKQKNRKNIGAVSTLQEEGGVMALGTVATEDRAIGGEMDR